MTYIPDDRNSDALPDETSQPTTSLLAGATWLLASKIISFAITAALPLLLVHRLSKMEYGHYKQLFLLLQSSLNMLPFGMNMSLFYFVPRGGTRAEKGNIILGVVIFYLVTTGIAGGALIIDPSLIQHLFHSATLTMLGRQIGFTLVPYVVASLLEVVLIANGDNRLSAIAIVFVNMARTLLILGAALFWGTISSILWCVLIVSVVQCCWLLSYLKSRFGTFWKSFQWRVLWTQLSYALPLGFAGLLWSLQVDVDNYFVSHYFDAAVFAVYTTGCFDVPLVGMLGDSVGAVLIPRISKLQALDATREIASVTVKAMRGLAFVYAPVFVFLFMVASQLISFLFSADYLASVPIFRINLMMVLLSIVAVDPIIRSYSSQRFWILRLNIVLLLLLVVTLYFGTTRYGLIGAVSCVIAVQYIVRFLITWRVSRLLKITWADLLPLKDVLKTLLAAAVGGICIYPLLDLGHRWGSLAALAICGVVYSAAYLLALLILRVPSAAEIELCRTRAASFFRLRFRENARG